MQDAGGCHVSVADERAERSVELEVDLGRGATGLDPSATGKVGRDRNTHADAEAVAWKRAATAVIAVRDFATGVRHAQRCDVGQRGTCIARARQDDHVASRRRGGRQRVGLRDRGAGGGVGSARTRRVVHDYSMTTSAQGSGLRTVRIVRQMPRMPMSTPQGLR